MPDDPGMDPTVRGLLRTLDPATTRTLERDPRSTIEPARQAKPDTGGQRAVELLGELRRRLAGPDGPDAPLRIERTLGEGGMGVVHLAEQVALGRKVAVKTLRTEHRDEAAKVKLLREAWLTGALEHPNVVPVYDVGLDEQGMPVIVLKRIEGVHWGELMRDAGRVRELFGAADLLEWNLQILMQVCNALHFAHSRGVVHRDLKPENVMVGEFGEVYVLDWGIAVSLRDDPSGRLPVAREQTEMAGTPCYMAPEMLGGEQPELSPRTDVYLLGATLYEILAGRPPHGGDNAMQVIHSVVTSRPERPEGAPPELVRICERTLAPDPDERFESAEQLRLALQGFLRHRSSARLAQQANERLEALQREVDAPAPQHEAEAEAQEQRIYNLFGACRFGFQQALRDWPDNGTAREGLGRAFETMIRRELSQNDPRAAGRLLAEMHDPPGELVERVERARREEEGRRRDLEALGRAYDPQLGMRTRTFIAALFGTLWTATPLVAGLMASGETLSLAHHAAGPAASLVLALGLGVWARESLSKTLINRRVFGAVVFMLVSHLTLLGGCELIGLEIDVVQSLVIFLWAVIAGMAAIFLDGRLAAVAAGYVAAFFASAHWPEQYYWLVAAANLNMAVFAVVLSLKFPRYALPPDPVDKIRQWLS